jgi:thiamine-phosphate pyrophosphorylase
MTLPRFYPIFPSADWLARLLPLGVRFVQLRVKDRPEAETRAEIARARDLCRAAGATLVVNDHWRLAIDEGCGFVHLGQEDLDTADLSAIRRAGLRLGLSTHDAGELDRALAARPDYVALGPVYPTILKAMRFAPQGLARVTAWKARIGELPLVAIGGLTVERAPGVLAAGADVVSVVTDVTLNPDPEARTRAWLEATR